MRKGFPDPIKPFLYEELTILPTAVCTFRTIVPKLALAEIGLRSILKSYNSQRQPKVSLKTTWA